MSDRTGDTRDTDNRGTHTQTRGIGSPGADSQNSQNSRDSQVSRDDRDNRDIESFEREADEYDDAAQADPDGDLDLEAPEADTAEQRVDVLQQHDEPITARPADDAEADPVDAAEQRRVVVVDEDDYR